MSFLKQLLQEKWEDVDYDDGDQSWRGPDYTVQYREAEERSAGFHTDIEQDTLANKNFREVLFTTEKTQLVLMTLQPDEEIGEEVHDGDQFFRFEEGEGKILIGEQEYGVTDGSAAVVPQGVNHNVINTGDQPLKLYAIYSPPQHEDGTVDKTKPKEE